MTLKSMTGFARSEGNDALASWHWEVRAVNGRGLDLRLRLPNGYEALEAPVRKLAAQRFTRGNVSINLQMKRGQAASEIQVNEAVLAKMLQLVEELDARTTLTTASAVDLLSLKGVLEVSDTEEDPAHKTERHAALLATLETALDDTVKARKGEGAHLQDVLAAQVGEIERLTAAIEASPARSSEAIRARLKRQVAMLFEAGDDSAAGLDPDRLYQEAALLSTRYDIEEELKRLHAHIASARELMASEEAVGRRLDFLTQEFNREANTLCSKSNDVEITRSGLALKAVIDQMREQVQNIE